MTDFIFNIEPGDVTYDIETHPNIFTLYAMQGENEWVFEISDRRNDLYLLKLFMDVLSLNRCRMVGFNNIGFDYPVIHFIYTTPYITVADIYNKAMSIINAPHNARFAHMIWERDRIVEQLDLYKIHHFDNISKATSLKVLEFNMRMDNIEDLPFDVGLHLTNEQKDILIKYNRHDVVATKEFYDRTLDMISLREGLSNTFNRDMMNMSDVKIGETLLVMGMEKHGIECYQYVNGRKQKKQTIRESVALTDVIFPYVSFERKEFNDILKYFRSQVITETKGVFKELTAYVNGLDYHFGTGGLHASIDSTIVYSTDTHQIVDVDVASFYPRMGMVNKLYPAHLGEQFCDAYLDLYKTRKTYDKKTLENEAYKLALNGAYGGSNNDYSPFLDKQYTMSITINGQLLLCMLVEQMIKIPGLKMIQANTDGITYLCPHEYIDHTRQICQWWEQVTGLELEEALYSRMFIRDVNNYCAEYEGGNLKRIGAYAYVTADEQPGTRELPYHKDWSARVVQKAAEAALVRSEDIRIFITSHDDIYDFMLKTKVPRSASLEWGGDKVQNIVRYYVSTDGDTLEKVMPAAGPIGDYKRANKLTDQYFNMIKEQVGDEWDERIHTKNKSKYEIRRSGINTGWTVQLCNNMKDQTFVDINYEFYIRETEKLVNKLR